MAIIAIDLGTSGAKVAIVGLDSRIIGWEFEPTTLHKIGNCGFEQDADDWWRAIDLAVRRLLAKKLVKPEQILAIGTSSMGEETVPVDENGKPLMRSMIWMDSRSADLLRSHVSGAVNVEGYSLYKLPRWMRLTGGAPSLSGKDPSGHKLFIRDNYPGIFNKTYKFLNSLDYINLKLTGEFTATYDSIIPSWVTDARDINRVVYDDKLMNYSGVPRDKFPALIKSTDVVGTLRSRVAEAWGLPSDVKVVGGGVDLNAASIGAGAVDDYQAHLCIGSSSFMNTHVPFKKTDIFHSIAALPSAIPGRYLVMNNQSVAGTNLQFIQDNIIYHKDELLREEKKPDVYKILDDICHKVPPGANGVMSTPWLAGERTPFEDHTLRGGLHNLSLNNNREDIVRAVYEGVAYNSRWMMLYVEKFMQRKCEPLNMVGGGAQSDAWCQIHADVLNRTVRQVEDPIQANARGAAMIAAVGLGEISFSDVSKLVRFSRIFEPNPANRAVYDRGFEVFKKLHRKSREICRDLNGN